MEARVLARKASTFYGLVIDWPTFHLITKHNVWLWALNEARLRGGLCCYSAWLHALCQSKTWLLDPHQLAPCWRRRCEVNPSQDLPAPSCFLVVPENQHDALGCRLKPWWLGLQPELGVVCAGCCNHGTRAQGPETDQRGWCGLSLDVGFKGVPIDHPRQTAFVVAVRERFCWSVCVSNAVSDCDLHTTLHARGQKFPLVDVGLVSQKPLQEGA